MGIHETKKLLISKGNGYQIEDMTYRMRKSFPAKYLARD
jgi:hypothetical protein